MLRKNVAQKGKNSVCIMNFKHCVPPSSRLQLDTLLLSVLDKLEESTGFDLRINSAFRPVSYEVSKGRSGSSAHCLGKAVDIYCYSDGMRYQIVKTALQLGINRIGIYETFVHLDVASNKDGKTTQVIWYG